MIQHEPIYQSEMNHIPAQTENGTDLRRMSEHITQDAIKNAFATFEKQMQDQETNFGNFNDQIDNLNSNQTSTQL